VAQLAVNDVLEIRLVSSVQSQVAINILHARVTGITAGSASEMEAAQRADVLIAPAMKGVMSSTATWRGIGLKKIRPLPVGNEATNVGLTGAGTNIGDMLPKQTSGLISLYSTQTGRNGRGRVYIPFPAEGSNEANSTPAAAYNVSLETICTLLLAGFTVTGLMPGGTATVQFGVFSKALNAFAALTAAICKDAWATQRRRGDFGRPNALPF